jgi:hypothetical protein
VGISRRVSGERKKEEKVKTEKEKVLKVKLEGSRGGETGKLLPSEWCGGLKGQLGG